MIAKKRVGFLTLGCKVNQYESEAIAQNCRGMGYVTAGADEICDLYIVNTCTVTQEADRKSCQMIRQLHRRNPAAPIIVTGCTAQRHPETVAAIEGVSAVVGNLRKLDCAVLADRFLSGNAPSEQIVQTTSLEGAAFEPMRIPSFPRTRQYIKIEDGCENHCAYCAICDARGPVRSKRADDILKEAISFRENGCREIVLTGIETASYGKDTRDTLGDLLVRLDAALPDVRFRLGSVDPNLFRPAFLEKIAGLSTVAPHFHISVQSGSSAVLRRMRRGYNAVQAADALQRIRAAIPGVMFTTDIIVGFPGETPEEFEETRRFLKEARFLKTHIFPFSARTGTEAAKMPQQILQAEKHRRVRILTEDEADMRRSIYESIVGSVFTVLFETQPQPGIWSGHAANFLEIRVPYNGNLHGTFADVCIVRACSNEEYCIGVLCQ